MSLEPRRTKRNCVPLSLHVRTSRTDPRRYDVVDDAGEILASGIPDINCARVFAAAPHLLDSLYDAHWELDSWAVMYLEEGEYADGTRLGMLLSSCDDALHLAYTLDGLYPIA